MKSLDDLDFKFQPSIDHELVRLDASYGEGAIAAVRPAGHSVRPAGHSVRSAGHATSPRQGFR